MNKIKIIAFCDDPIVFLNNRAIDITEASKYPGLSFIPLLANKVAEKNIEFVTGDIALLKITKESFKPCEVGLISSLGSKLGEYLLSLGVIPLIISSGESPLWIPNNYLNLEKIVSTFKYKIFFDGAIKYIKNEKESYFPFFFPSWHEDNIQTIVEYNSKKFMSVVVGNKYIINNSKLNLKEWIKKTIKKKLIKNYRYSNAFYEMIDKNELQSKRLELIEFFAKKSKIDLYGSGWNILDNLPNIWQKKVSLIIKDIYKGISINKIETISKYKFNLCLENLRYPGYITEKIIDCFVAGTIPVYLGAQDINSFIPSDCFVDVSKFRNYQELLKFLNNMNIETYIHYLDNGRKFLNSSRGRLFSYESVANEFYKLIEREIK